MGAFIFKTVRVFLCATVVLMESSCFRHGYEIRIAGPTEITSQWLEVQAKPLLQADKDSHLIVLELEPPFKYDLHQEGKEPNKGQGILMPDGEVINPEIQIIDQNGTTFDLVYAGARRSFWPAYGLPYPNQWPRDRHYKTVRIRSTRPIKCKAIYWFAESSRDLK